VCTAVTGDAFADLAPAPPTSVEKGRVQSDRHAASTCVVTVGTGDDTLLLSVGVDLFADTAAAKGAYEGFRGVVFKDHRDAREVTGVETAAYFFVDPDTGPHLVVLSGNAHLSVWATYLNRTKTPPSHVEDRLITTAKATLSKLPAA
jgi:hypothetical protein